MANFSSIKLTKVNVGSLRALVSVKVGELFFVTGIKVIEGSKGLFIGMPSRKDEKSNEYKDVCFPVSKEAREELTEAILEVYYAA